LIDDVGNAATVNVHAVANEIVPRLGLVEVLGKAYPKEIKFAKRGSCKSLSKKRGCDECLKKMLTSEINSSTIFIVLITRLKIKFFETFCKRLKRDIICQSFCLIQVKRLILMKMADQFLGNLMAISRQFGMDF
jgi:hypothetical protein